MKRTWTIILDVGDVGGSFKWYQSVLGLPATAHVHHYFGQIANSLDRVYEFLLGRTRS